MITTVRHAQICLQDNGWAAAPTCSLMRDVFQYPVFPGGQEVLSLREHFGFYSLPQLHVNFLLWARIHWALIGTGAPTLERVVGAVLETRRIFAGADLQGFTIGRITFLDKGPLKNLHNFPPNWDSVNEITHAVSGPGSSTGVDSTGNEKAIDRFDMIVFGEWTMGATGLSPWTTCTDDSNMTPACVDGGCYFMRCPVVRVISGKTPEVVRALARTIAHEIGHFVAWGLHPIFDSDSVDHLMAQSSVSSSTKIPNWLALKFLSSCWMNNGCNSF